MPNSRTSGPPTTSEEALDAASRRLLTRWDAHLSARGTDLPGTDDFLSFGGARKLEMLQKVLNKVRPGQAAPLRLALKSRRSERWRRFHPVPESPETRRARRKAELSIPEDRLPRPWRRALREMRALRKTMADGLLALDERTPPSAKVVRNLASTLRIFAKVCEDHGVDVALTREALDLWRSARHRAGNRNVTLAARLKELRILAIWCELDDDIIEQLASLQRRYQRAGRGEWKSKERWMLSRNVGIADVWGRAEELLEEALAAPLGSALRARLILDAACLALSVVCPLRCGDLHRIEFGTHLRRSADGWSLEIRTEKIGFDYVRPVLWPELTPFLDAVLLLDMPEIGIEEAYAEKSGTPIFSRDGGQTGVHVSWPTRCWTRQFGIGEHIIRSLWHTMMFDSEDDDQWIALALCGQGHGRTAVEYIVKGNRRRASRRGQAKLRSARRAAMQSIAP